MGRLRTAGRLYRSLLLRLEGADASSYWEIASPLSQAECQRRLDRRAAEDLRGPDAVTVMGRRAGAAGTAGTAGTFEAMLKASPDQFVGIGVFPWPVLAAFGVLEARDDGAVLAGFTGVPSATMRPSQAIAALGPVVTALAIGLLLTGPDEGQEWGLLACGLASTIVAAILATGVRNLKRSAPAEELIEGLAAIVEGTVVVAVGAAGVSSQGRR